MNFEDKACILLTTVDNLSLFYKNFLSSCNSGSQVKFHMLTNNDHLMYRNQVDDRNYHGFERELVQSYWSVVLPTPVNKPSR